MKLPGRFVVFTLAWLISWFLIGCSLSVGADGTPTINATQAHGTVQALVSQQALEQITSTVTPILQAASPTSLLEPLYSPTPAATTPPPPTPRPSPTAACDRAAAGNPIDVTVPDDTVLNPGQALTKIWRLQNVGTCTWTRRYAARFFYGSQMSAPDLVYLAQEVAPGQAIEIAVDMVAPATPGAHQGNWKLANADGQLFGIGPNGDAPFWVRIVVMLPATATATLTPTPTATSSPTPTSTTTPSPTPTPPVQVEGSLNLLVGQALNLDDGALNAGEDDDLAYQVDGGGFHVLAPLPGTLLGVYGLASPGPAECQASSLGAAPIAFESVTPGTYLCYRSDQGRPGWLRYDSLDSASQSASLVFRTWLNP